MQYHTSVGCDDVVVSRNVSREESSNDYYHGVGVANEDDNLSLCGILAKLYLVAESVCVFRPSITVLREGSKGPPPPPLIFSSLEDLWYVSFI